MKRKTTTGAAARRVRWTLLVLLWIWVGCIALILDLFWNVRAFDRMRPDAKLYRAARFVAHRLVGERYAENDAFARAATNVARSVPIARGEHETPPGVRPRPGTPAGRHLLASLERVSQRHEDPRRRVAALRGLTRMFGADAEPALHRAQDDANPDVRAAARRFMDELEIDSETNGRQR